MVHNKQGEMAEAALTAMAEGMPTLRSQGEAGTAGLSLGVHAALTPAACGLWAVLGVECHR